MESPYSNKLQKQKQAYLVHAILNDGIHFEFVQSSYPIFSTKQSYISFWKASCYFWKVLSENFTDMFVRFIVFNEIPYYSDIPFHIFRHICLLTSGSVNSKKNKWRETVDMCQSVEFETAFKYSLKTPFIFKGSFFELMRTSLPTIKRYLFCPFDRNVFDCRKGTFFALFKRSLQTEKRYLFRALKFCLVQWEMHEKWTILTSKYFHSKALNTCLFSLKRYLF